MKGKLPRIFSISKRRRTPSIQALIVAFITLFILFIWFSFGLTVQIESMGRQLQVKTDELELLQRQADAYRKEISVRGSQFNMAERARLLGYQPAAPFFLTVAEPFAEPAGDLPSTSGQATVHAGAASTEGQTTNQLLLLLTGGLTDSESATTP